MAYTRRVLIVETRVFAKRIDVLLSTEELRELQLDLVARPNAGVVIPGSGGLRKLRWLASGRGQRSGLRIIYFYHQTTDRILLLFAFAKNERTDLTPAQRQRLRHLVESEYP